MKNKKNFTVHIYKADIERLPEHITGLIEKSKEFIRKAVYVTLQAEKKPPRCDISIILTSDDKIKKLNYEYRKVNLPTDVLCFPYSSRPPFKCDMFISIESSYRQSRQYKHSHQKEITFLTIHGILHLLGWRDNKDTLKKRMLKRQTEILQLIK
jgi:probable rRNA maturation factor